MNISINHMINIVADKSLKREARYINYFGFQKDFYALPIVFIDYFIIEK